MLVVSRMPPFDRPATYDDLLQLPDHLMAEILDGELHAGARPAPEIAASTMALGGMLRRGLDAARVSDNWQVLPGPELHLGGDVLVPGLAGWRRSRLPDLPATAFFSVAPDWVCEVLSSYTASLRARKLAIYAAEGVSHAWLIDPVAHALEVRRLEDGRWIPVASHFGEQVVCAAPFESVELPLAALWPGGADRGRARRKY